MQKNIKIYTLLTLFLLLFLALSGLAGKYIASVLYLLGFAVPIFVGFVYSQKDRKKREAEKGIAEPPDNLFLLSGRSACFMLPLVFPVVAVIFAVSFLTSRVLLWLGVSSFTAPSGSFLYLVAIYALAPAVLEEMVFRYLPMKLLSPYSKTSALVLSSLYFGFFHMDLAKIPYALLAGAIMMWINLALDSVWPSFILHSTNNLISLIWSRAYGGYAVVFVSVLLALTFISLVIIAFFRKVYFKKFKAAISDRKRAYVSYIVFLIPIISIIESVCKILLGGET